MSLGLVTALHVEMAVTAIKRSGTTHSFYNRCDLCGVVTQYARAGIFAHYGVVHKGKAVRFYHPLTEQEVSEWTENSSSMAWSSRLKAEASSSTTADGPQTSAPTD